MRIGLADRQQRPLATLLDFSTDRCLNEGCRLVELANKSLPLLFNLVEQGERHRQRVCIARRRELIAAQSWIKRACLYVTRVNTRLVVLQQCLHANATNTAACAIKRRLNELAGIIDISRRDNRDAVGHRRVEHFGLNCLELTRRISGLLGMGLLGMEKAR